MSTFMDHIHRLREAEPELRPFPEYMYVDFPDGTVRRCKATPCPVWGYPTTPGFNSPEWEVVERAPDPGFAVVDFPDHITRCVPVVTFDRDGFPEVAS